MLLAELCMRFVLNIDPELLQLSNRCIYSEESSLLAFVYGMAFTIIFLHEISVSVYSEGLKRRVYR
jgi:hypothetical protein